MFPNFTYHNCLGSKRSYQLQLSAFPKTDLKNHSNRGFDEMTSIVTGSFFEMLLAARCINRLHRRINACGSADYFAIWHRNCIDVGGLKMDSWRASVFATCVPIFGLACKGKQFHIWGQAFDFSQAFRVTTDCRASIRNARNSFSMSARRRSSFEEMSVNFFVIENGV